MKRKGDWLQLPHVRELWRSTSACQCCGSSEWSLIPHHRHPKSRARSYKGRSVHELANLVLVCPECHGRFHARCGEPTPKNVTAVRANIECLQRRWPGNNWWKMAPVWALKGAQ